MPKRPLRGSVTPPVPPSEEDVFTSPVAHDGLPHAQSASTSSDGIVAVTTFVPGDVLADRYKVVRFVARGGMGEVYEVEDLALHGRLALKTIRPEIARDPVAVARFKREISIARRITHPNVSRVYDLGVHRGEPETMFLTMEFLQGDTLANAIAKQGKMTAQEALPFVEQIAAGLAAAHDAGVIHRDFKSPNVMLVPAQQGSLRAIVTDFGLARFTVNEDGASSLSDTGMVMGTPAYMAPEQVEGLDLTPSADIYALGIVMYEMLTANRPFSAQTPMSCAVKRLTERPVPPSRFVPDIDRVWESVILRCLARRPEHRYQSAREVAAALHRGEVVSLGTIEEDFRPAADASTIHLVPDHSPTVPIRASAPGRVKFVTPMRAVIAGTVVLAAATVAVVPRFMGNAAAPAAAASMTGKAAGVSLRRSIAILGLHNTSGRAEDDWIGDAVSEMLAAELGTGGILRITDAEQVTRFRRENRIDDPDAISGNQLAKVHQSLSADAVVVGSFASVGTGTTRILRINVRLLDAASGRVLKVSSASGTEEQMFDLVSRASGTIRQELGVRSLSPDESVEVAAALPHDRDAVRLYSEGIARLRSLDAARALPLLQQAAAKAEHPLILTALSTAHSMLGEEAQAKDAAVRAVARSSTLSRERKLLVDARLYEASRDWTKAVETERTLAESFPDNIDYGLNLAAAQLSAGNPDQALVTVQALRRLPKPVSNDARIDLLEARVQQEFGQPQKQKSLAATAAAKARANGSQLLLARARLMEATADLYLGDLAATTAAIDDSRKLFVTSGDTGGAARALELTAQAVHQQGDLGGERRLLDEALAMHREIGDRGSEARVLSNLATLLIAQGRPAEAAAYFDRAIATLRETGARYAEAVTLNNYGAMMFNRGDLAAAQHRYKEALDAFAAINEKTGKAMTLTNLAEVLEASGDLTDASSMHEESLAINREIGLKSGMAYDLYRLGEIFIMRGEFVAASQRLNEALRLQNESGDKLGAADSRMSLQAIAIEERRAEDAERNLREIEEILRTEGATERSTYARAMLSDALLAQGKLSDARAEAESAWTDAEKSEDRRVRFKVAVSRARAMAASRAPVDLSRAVSFLDGIIREASKSSFVGAELDARLAAGEIELGIDRAKATPRLSAVARDAGQRGFGRIARRAAAAAV